MCYHNKEHTSVYKKVIIKEGSFYQQQFFYRAEGRAVCFFRHNKKACLEKSLLKKSNLYYGWHVIHSEQFVFNE